MTQPPPTPGWYPDPSGKGPQRYWDGSNWGPAAPTTASASAPIKKKRRWPWIVGAVVVAIIFFAAIGSNDHKPGTSASSGATSQSPSRQAGAPSEPPDNPSTSTPASHDVTYEIESDGSLSTVTYFNEINDQKQDTDVPSPWSKTFTSEATYPMYGVGAQTTGTHVSCKISINGQVRDQKSATGRYAVVNCNAAA